MSDDILLKEKIMTDTQSTDPVLEINTPVSETKTADTLKDVQTVILEKQSLPVAVQEASEELTIEEKYQPTPHMLVWIDTAHQLMTDSVTEISETCKISRTAWYDWLKDDKFRLWFKTEWDKRLSGESWKLDAIGMKRAKLDHKYWHDMQNRVGNLIDKQPIVQNNTQINLNKYQDEV